MGLIRQAGYNGIAATIRDAEYDNTLLLALLRLYACLVNSRDDFVRSPAPHPRTRASTETSSDPLTNIRASI